VLNGVGGWTVAEAKERVSDYEFGQWCAYIRKRGSLDLGSRLELGVALLATVVKTSAGHRAKITDFLPKREEDKEMGLQEVFAMFKAKAAETNAAKRGVERPRRKFKRGT
jgi:hypothetical protein